MKKLFRENSSKQLIRDKWGRPMSYLRIAVTDRCNLRCFYCMPKEGIEYLPKKEMLTYEEILKLTVIFSQLGISKVRLTGGEPFARRDIMDFMNHLNQIDGIEKIHVTTNGVLTLPYLDKLVDLKIAGVNLSLDCLNAEMFHKITRRDEYNTVMQTFHGLLERKINTKINMVVMNGTNDDQIIPMLELAKNHPVDVRYIEEMPFNGTGKLSNKKTLNYQEIFQRIQSVYPTIAPIEGEPHTSSTSYKIDGFVGTLGIIPAYSRTFCGSCNRIRLTTQGVIKSCLYDSGKLDIKTLLRDGASDQALQEAVANTWKAKAKDGFEAERSRKNNQVVSESMSTIGG